MKSSGPVMVYLGAPYSSPKPAVRELRFHQANIAAAKLMAQGFVVFSPISHSHPIAAYLEEHLLLDHEFWMAQDLGILEKADKLVVLRVDGWEKSRGVTAEIAHAEKCGIPIEYMDY